MTDSPYSSGQIDIRPEVQATSSNRSDSTASNTQELAATNEFGAQDLSIGKADATASFAPVQLTVSPQIRSSGGVSAEAKPLLLAAVAAAVIVGLVVLRRRRFGYGYYRCCQPAQLGVSHADI